MPAARAVVGAAALQALAVGVALEALVEDALMRCTLPSARPSRCTGLDDLLLARQHAALAPHVLDGRGGRPRRGSGRAAARPRAGPRSPRPRRAGAHAPRSGGQRCGSGTARASAAGTGRRATPCARSASHRALAIRAGVLAGDEQDVGVVARGRGRRAARVAAMRAYFSSGWRLWASRSASLQADRGDQVAAVGGVAPDRPGRQARLDHRARAARTLPVIWPR